MHSFTCLEIRLSTIFIASICKNMMETHGLLPLFLFCFHSLNHLVCSTVSGSRIKMKSNFNVKNFVHTQFIIRFGKKKGNILALATQYSYTQSVLFTLRFGKHVVYIFINGRLIIKKSISIFAQAF